MNVLEREALLELNALVDDMSGNQDIKGLVIMSGRHDQFIVGANIEEIAAFTTAADATDGAAQMHQSFKNFRIEVSYGSCNPWTLSRWRPRIVSCM